MNRLEARQLVKHYRARKAVSDVSIQIEGGEVVGLLGPNGAGKTTSFYMIVGLIPCDGGKITLGHDDITNLPMHMRARKGIGYLPQEASVFRKLTVADNIMAILQTIPGISSKEQEMQRDELLEELHITHIQSQLGMSLSGGERRRVEIARALATRPKFILLDEPFAGVDPISVLDIQRIISHLRDRGIGVLITDHNVRETLGICGRAYIMNEGRVIAQGTPEAILDDEQVRRVYLGDSFHL